MPVETPSIFSKIIEDHLELKRRNAQLDGELPLSRYINDDPFQNHPLFKTEEQARLEETLGDGEAQAPVAVATVQTEQVLQDWTESPAYVAASAESEPEQDDGLWGRSRDFDWGD